MNLVPPTNNPLTEYQDVLNSLVEDSISQNTKRAYQSALSRLDLWLRDHKVQLNDNSLASYLAHLFESGKSPATCSLVIAAVEFTAKVSTHASPVQQATQRTLAGIRRKGQNRGRGQSAGLSYEQVLRIINACDRPRAHAVKHETERVARRRATLDRVIVSCLFMAGMRRSELVALTWEDVEFKNDTVLIRIRKSKTDQEGTRADYRLLKGQCAESVRALKESLGEIDLNKKVVGLSGQMINLRLQSAAKHAGIKTDQLTSHSGRIGLASELTTRGAEIGSVALAGGWKSPQMVIHYSRQAQTERGAVAKYL